MARVMDNRDSRASGRTADANARLLNAPTCLRRVRVRRAYLVIPGWPLPASQHHN